MFENYNIIAGGGARYYKAAMGHVGSSNQPNRIKACDRARDISIFTNKTNQFYNTKKVGSDSLAQIISEERAFKKPMSNHRTDPFNEEIKALQFDYSVGKQITTVTEELKENIYNDSSEEEKEKKEEDEEEGKQQEDLIEENAIIIIAENERKEDDQ